MIVNYDGGTDRQRGLVSQTLDTIERNGYPFDALALTLNFTFPDEPSLAGHREFACTNETGAVADIEIRNTLDDPARKEPYNGEDFFAETVAHEVGHAIAFYLITTTEANTKAASLFTKRGAVSEGYPGPAGTLADLNPAEAGWQDKLQEGIAETFKDIYLLPDERKFDNRSNWILSESGFRPFLELIGIHGANGGPVVGQVQPQTVVITAPLYPPGNQNRAAVHAGVVSAYAAGGFWANKPHTGIGTPYYDFRASPPQSELIGYALAASLRAKGVKTIDIALDLSMDVDYSDPNNEIQAATEAFTDSPTLAQYVGWGTARTGTLKSRWRSWRKHVDDYYEELGRGSMDFHCGWAAPFSAFANEAGFLTEGYVHIDLLRYPQTPKVYETVPIPDVELHGPASLLFFVSGASPMPLGPGVIYHWQRRVWTGTYYDPGSPGAGEPSSADIIPDYPYDNTADGSLDGAAPGTIRRGRPPGRKTSSV